MNRSPHRISGQRRQARKREEPDNQRRMEEVEGEDDEEEDDISQSLTVLHLKDAQPQVVASDRGNDIGALGGAAFRGFRRNLVCEEILPLPQEESALIETCQDLGDHEERAPLQEQLPHILPFPQEEVGEGAQLESRQDLGDHNAREPIQEEEQQNLPFPQAEVGESAHALEDYRSRAPLIAGPQEEDPVNSLHEFDEILQACEEKWSTRDLEDQLNCLSEILLSLKYYDQLSNHEACLSCHREEIEVVVYPCGHKYVCRACFHRNLINVRPFICLICRCLCTSHEFL